jgi:hypothetical protein
LGFGQIRTGKFSKYLKKFNVKKSIDSIIDIQQYQADSKFISLKTNFKGFPTNTSGVADYTIYSEEKRIQ